MNGKRKTNESKLIAITSEPPILGLIRRSFVTGLVSATVTEVTSILTLWQQLIDKVGAAVLYLNKEKTVATTSSMVCRVSINADFPFGSTLSDCRMTTPQPGRVASTTFVDQWTFGHHFSPCISLETIPTIERVVTFWLTCCIVAIFSVCVC